MGVRHISFFFYFCRDSIRKQHSAFFSHKIEGDFSEQEYEGVHEGKKSKSYAIHEKIKTGLYLSMYFAEIQLSTSRKHVNYYFQFA